MNIFQSQKITEEEGVSAAVGFDVGQQQIGIDEMINSQRGLKILAGYDEAAFCAHTFRLEVFYDSFYKVLRFFFFIVF